MIFFFRSHTIHSNIPCDNHTINLPNDIHIFRQLPVFESHAIVEIEKEIEFQADLQARVANYTVQYVAFYIHYSQLIKHFGYQTSAISMILINM